MKSVSYYPKRPLDLLFSTGILLLALPLFLLLTLLLAVTLRGNPFFIQRRPGKNGRIFRIIKFRTMTNARNGSGELLPDEQRLTSIGKFVRSTSLDELPQLLNVIKGDMALVGPRPLLVSYLPLYTREQARRHLVRPGITGWAQVHGRNAISWEEKFKLDVWYVDHCSFQTDCHILFLTLKKVFKREGIAAVGTVSATHFTGSEQPVDPEQLPAMHPYPKLIRLTTVALSQNLLLRGQLRFLSQYFDVLAVASGEEELRRVGEREGVKVLPLEMHREIALSSDIRSLLTLFRLFRTERPHIVHANTPKGSLLAMIAAKMARVPHRIYTVTGLRFETERGGMRLLLKMMEQITCFCATKVIPEGEGVRRILLEEHITRKPLQVIHHGNINGIDLEYYRRSEEVNQLAFPLTDDSRFTFCFVGRIVPDKGIPELISAFQRVHTRFPETRLFLVGPFETTSTPLDSAITEIIRNHPDIQHFGFQSDVRPFLAASHAFVFPSHREGFPNVVLQAAAMNLPCIVTDINGSNEIIRHKQNGLIIPPFDAEALFQAMQTLLLDSVLTQRMAKSARSHIESAFNQHDVWQALRNMYQSLD